jgi:hypothetical protein
MNMSRFIIVKRLCYDQDYSYAPPQEDAIVDPGDISRVIAETDHRGTGPFARIYFKDGKEMVVASSIQALYAALAGDPSC